MIWYEVDGRTIVASINKVASTSIAEALVGCNRLTNHRAELYDKRVMWIREPIERLYSCWRFLKTTGSQLATMPDLRSYERFVDYILRIPDTHWTPQANLVTHQDRFIPTVVYSFKAIGDTFSRCTGRKLGKFNVSSNIEYDKRYRLDDLKEFYREDLRLWHLAVR